MAVSGDFTRLATLSLSRPAASTRFTASLAHETACTSRLSGWAPAIRKRRRSAISSPGSARTDYHPR